VSRPSTHRVRRRDPGRSACSPRPASSERRHSGGRILVAGLRLTVLAQWRHDGRRTAVPGTPPCRRPGVLGVKPHYLPRRARRTARHSLNFLCDQRTDPSPVGDGGVLRGRHPPLVGKGRAPHRTRGPVHPTPPQGGLCPTFSAVGWVREISGTLGHASSVGCAKPCSPTFSAAASRPDPTYQPQDSRSRSPKVRSRASTSTASAVRIVLTSSGAGRNASRSIGW
jgi:hypothetical protein